VHQPRVSPVDLPPRQLRSVALHARNGHDAVRTYLRPGREGLARGVTVYVPNRALAPIPDGPSCDACTTTLSGEPVVAAKTDASGAFVLGSAAAGRPDRRERPAGHPGRQVAPRGDPRRQRPACADTRSPTST
jgi:hypothetical protein